MKKPNTILMLALAFVLGAAFASSILLPSGIGFFHELGATAAAWAQAVLAGAAILAAIGVGYMQVEHLRREQILLNKPRMTFERKVQREAPQLEITARSVGLGPAIIDSYEVRLDNVVLESRSNEFWTNLIAELELPRCRNSGGTVIGEGQILAAGTTRVLFRWIVNEAGELPTNTALHAQADRITITIRYRSLHGEHAVASTDRSLDVDIVI